MTIVEMTLPKPFDMEVYTVRSNAVQQTSRLMYMYNSVVKWQVMVGCKLAISKGQIVWENCLLIFLETTWCLVHVCGCTFNMFYNSTYSWVLECSSPNSLKFPSSPKFTPKFTQILLFFPPKGLKQTQPKTVIHVVQCRWLKYSMFVSKTGQ